MIQHGALYVEEGDEGSISAQEVSCCVHKIPTQYRQFLKFGNLALELFS